MANLAFSIGAALGTLTVSVLSAIKGAWVVAAVFGLLAAGFVMRASEPYWRRPR